MYRFMAIWDLLELKSSSLVRRDDFRRYEI
jgi:hypothetical protein